MPRSLSSQVSDGAGGLRELLRPRVNRSELVFFTKQLAAFLQSGVTMGDALGHIAGQLWGGHLREVVRDLQRRVRSGIALSHSLRAYPDVFPPLYVGLVAAGEAAGNLDVVLKELGNFLAKERRFAGRLRSALAYPLIVLALSLLTVYLLLTQVMPRFKALAEGLDVELPWVTRFMFALGDVLASPYFVLGSLLAAAFGGWYVFARGQGRDWLAQAVARLPVLERVYRYGDYYRWALVMSLLKRAGVPLAEGMGYASQVVFLEDFRQGLLQGSRRVRMGLSLSLALAEYLPPLLLAVVRTGEESGRLDELLRDAALYYEELLDETLEVLGALVQPVMIVLVGGVVLFILAAVFLPYGSILQGVQNLQR